MDNALKQLAKIADGLMKATDVGKEYTVEYVKQRLEAAIDEYPHDAVIRAMASAVGYKSAKGTLTISQKDIYNIYNHVAGLNANSEARNLLGDLFNKTAESPIKSGSQTEYSVRAPQAELDMSIEHNPLSNVFDKTAVAGSYYNPSIAKIAKVYIEEELSKIDVPASDISVFAGNDQAILFKVAFKNKLGTASVAIPVEIGNGVKTPEVFFDTNKFISLTAENLNKYIVKNANSESIEVEFKIGGVRTASSAIVQNLVFEEDGPKPIEVDAVKLPAALVNIASFEESLIDASTGFPIETVKMAKAICLNELNKMGFKAQVKLADHMEDSLICQAELDSKMGKVAINLVVDVIDNKPLLPSVFYREEDKVLDFNRAEIVKLITVSADDRSSVKRYSDDMSNMTYNQLKDEVIAGVAVKNFVRCEAALNLIEDKFGPDFHKSAMSDYAKYLQHMSNGSVVEHKCNKLITKGSVEPRCGHFNVPISRVAYDTSGRCILKDRQVKYDNLVESGASMRTNKIILT